MRVWKTLFRGGHYVTTLRPQTRGLANSCKHEFHSVYYGSEWEVECKKCDKNVFDVHPHDEAVKIIKSQ